MGFRVLYLLAFFTVFSTLVGAFIGLVISWILGYAFSGLIVFLATLFFFVSIIMDIAFYYRSPKMILKKYHAKPSENERLNDIVERMATNARIPTPKVYILPIDVPNSFATGTSRKNASVCVTEGILSLNKDEIENIVAHEMWHIANNDIKIQSVTAAAANTFHITWVFSAFAVFLVKLAITEGREYKADYYGTRYSKKPMEMGSALSKMNEIARHNPMEGSPAFEPIWSVNPFKRKGYKGMFSTHPPTARRVKRVEDMVHEGIPEPPEELEV